MSLSYHDATKHSPESIRRTAHRLDWSIMPRPFKVYLDLEGEPLPRDFTVSTLPALDAIGGAAAGDGGVDLDALARLLHFSAGVLRRRAYPGGEVFYRAAACTGALYHIDVYVVAGDLPGLAAGVYHFGPHDFALRRLRDGDHRGVLAAASGANPAVAGAPATLVLTSTFWRNAWKYRARAYRHCFWDSGTILANLLAVAAAAGVPAQVALGFADAEVNRLLDLDVRREVSLALVALGRGDSCAAAAPAVEPLGLPTLPASEREVEYPEILAAHEASSLASGEGAAAWRAAGRAAGSPPAAAGGAALPPRSESIEAVILRRGSKRRFRREPIGAGELGAILRLADRGIDADYVAAGGMLADAYVIANDVTGLEPGAYFYDRDRDRLELLRAGSFRPQAGFLALGQDLAEDAAANVYWLADLDAVLARLGERGYRAAQLDAAVAGGRAYLASYALRLGATGLTFFDDAVIEFFSPHAAGKSVLFLMAIGR